MPLTLSKTFAWQTFASLRLFTLLVYVCTYCVPIARLGQNKPFPLLYLGHAQIMRAVKKICRVNQRQRNVQNLHKKRVQLPQDWSGTETWPPFHCFGTQMWSPWRHVKTHNCCFSMFSGVALAAYYYTIYILLEQSINIIESFAFSPG